MSFAGPVLRRARIRANGSLLTEPADSGSLASPSYRSPLERERPSGTLILIAGIAVGALLGVAATLLVAPQSGEETRRLLSRHSRRLARRGREMWGDLGDEARRQRKSVRRRFASFL
jgi:YtxH-like protein